MASLWGDAARLGRSSWRQGRSRPVSCGGRAITNARQKSDRTILHRSHFLSLSNCRTYASRAEIFRSPGVDRDPLHCRAASFRVRIEVRESRPTPAFGSARGPPGVCDRGWSALATDRQTLTRVESPFAMDLHLPPPTNIGLWNPSYSLALARSGSCETRRLGRRGPELFSRQLNLLPGQQQTGASSHWLVNLFGMKWLARLLLLRWLFQD
jgi:hypothetical protein